MTKLNGMKDADYLAQFLGRKIAIKTGNSDCYDLYPRLVAIYYNRIVVVEDSQGKARFFPWEECENPYVILLDKEVNIK